MQIKTSLVYQILYKTCFDCKHYKDLLKRPTKMVSFYAFKGHLDYYIIGLTMRGVWEMAFDIKKEEKVFYHQKQQPSIVNIPAKTYLAVRGKGNPNEKDGEYSQAIEQLYGIAYTIKMSKNTTQKIDGYFDFVVSPLEGLWWQQDIKGYDVNKKDSFEWIALMRIPEFVSDEVLEWAKIEATHKKGKDYSKVNLFTYNEGLCVQALHLGPYDLEPETTEKMHDFAEEEGYALDINESRHHHEIYLSDPIRTAPEKLKTIVRHPISKK